MAPAREIGEVVLDFHDLEGVITRASPFSPFSMGQFPIKDPSPSPPVITDVQVPVISSGVLEIFLTLPTTNEDGSVLAPAEMIRLRLHHSTSPGVTTSDDYVDFGVSETLLWAPNYEYEIHFAIRVMDSHGNWSELSNEESGTPGHFPTPESDLWMHRIGKDSIFTNNSPSPGNVAWSNVILWWKEDSYEITNGNTGHKYIYWKPTTPTTFQTSDSPPSLTHEDVIIGFNDGGTWRLMVYSPMVIADYLRAGIIQSGNWGTSEGTEIDLWEGTIKIGGSVAPKFQVNKSGEISAVGGTIGGFTIESNQLKGGTGGTTVGLLPGSYPFYAGHATPASAPFRVTNAGVLYATGATISGALTTGTGSVISATHITTGEMSAARITSGTMSGSRISAGTITGSTLQTAESGDRLVISPVSGSLNHFMAIYEGTESNPQTRISSGTVLLSSGSSQRILLTSISIGSFSSVLNFLNAAAKIEFVLGGEISGGSASYPVKLVHIDDIEAISTSNHYFGGKDTDGSWRIVRSGNNLVFERRESGSWVIKHTMAP